MSRLLYILQSSKTFFSSADFHNLSKWYEQAEKVHKGEITKAEYDSWRYNFSEADLPGIHMKVTPSQELSDALIRMSKEKGED